MAPECSSADTTPISIDRKTAFIGSGKGATVQNDACCLALFIKLSNASLSLPHNTLLTLKALLLSFQAACESLELFCPYKLPL